MLSVTQPCSCASDWQCSSSFPRRRTSISENADFSRVRVQYLVQCSVRSSAAQVGASTVPSVPTTQPDEPVLACPVSAGSSPRVRQGCKPWVRPAIQSKSSASSMLVYLGTAYVSKRLGSGNCCLDPAGHDSVWSFSVV